MFTHYSVRIYDNNRTWIYFSGREWKVLLLGRVGVITLRAKVMLASSGSLLIWVGCGLKTHGHSIALFVGYPANGWDWFCWLNGWSSLMLRPTVCMRLIIRINGGAVGSSGACPHSSTLSTLPTIQFWSYNRCVENLLPTKIKLIKYEKLLWYFLGEGVSRERIFPHTVGTWPSTTLSTSNIDLTTTGVADVLPSTGFWFSTFNSLMISGGFLWYAWSSS